LRGLKEERTRSHVSKVKNFLHNGRQPKKWFSVPTSPQWIASGSVLKWSALRV
jgi:hypothetical protein